MGINYFDWTAFRQKFVYFNAMKYHWFIFEDGTVVCILFYAHLQVCLFVFGELPILSENLGPGKNWQQLSPLLIPISAQIVSTFELFLVLKVLIRSPLNKLTLLWIGIYLPNYLNNLKLMKSILKKVKWKILQHMLMQYE